jgi:hypothetical protein
MTYSYLYIGLPNGHGKYYVYPFLHGETQNLNDWFSMQDYREPALPGWVLLRKTDWNYDSDHILRKVK